MITVTLHTRVSVLDFLYKIMKLKDNKVPFTAHLLFIPRFNSAWDQTSQ